MKARFKNSKNFIVYFRKIAIEFEVRTRTGTVSVITSTSTSNFKILKCDISGSKQYFLIGYELSGSWYSPLSETGGRIDFDLFKFKYKLILATWPQD